MWLSSAISRSAARLRGGLLSDTLLYGFVYYADLRPEYYSRSASNSRNGTGLLQSAQARTGIIAGQIAAPLCGDFCIETQNRTGCPSPAIVGEARQEANWLPAPYGARLPEAWQAFTCTIAHVAL